MYSSVTLPRSSNGSVRKVSNSSFIQPTPAPTITRPPDKTSRLASIFAVTMGLRYGRIMTLVTKRMRCVAPARNPIVIRVSR